jgi:hypothetical protein
VDSNGKGRGQQKEKDEEPSKVVINIATLKVMKGAYCRWNTN